MLALAVNIGYNAAKGAVNMWIYQHRDWPNFNWDVAKLTIPLADVRHRQGRLLGRMEGLGYELKREACLNTSTLDVVKSSAIEGETLYVDEVRSSVARRLGIEIAGQAPAGWHVDGIVEMMLEATDKFSEPLTEDRLFGWHAAMFPAGRSGLREIRVGVWRGADSGPMRIVSGRAGRGTIHFEAPGAERIQREMETFLFWFEHGAKVDPVLKAAIAHLWFLTIHPFEDGNGRIARAIADMALARANGMAERYCSLSAQLESERGDYYDQLEKQQRGTLDITAWLQWFVECLGRAVAGAEESLCRVLHKARLWERINEHPVNERQRQVIKRMLEDDFVGHMNTSKYAKLAECSKDTALRDIQILKSRAIFLQNPGGGRSTSYRLPEYRNTGQIFSGIKK